MKHLELVRGEMERFLGVEQVELWVKQEARPPSMKHGCTARDLSWGSEEPRCKHGSEKTRPSCFPTAQKSVSGSRSAAVNRAEGAERDALSFFMHQVFRVLTSIAPADTHESEGGEPGLENTPHMLRLEATCC